jgi:hypothetical protein
MPQDRRCPLGVSAWSDAAQSWTFESFSNSYAPLLEFNGTRKSVPHWKSNKMSKQSDDPLPAGRGIVMD